MRKREKEKRRDKKRRTEEIRREQTRRRREGREGGKTNKVKKPRCFFSIDQMREWNRPRHRNRRGRGQRGGGNMMLPLLEDLTKDINGLSQGASSTNQFFMVRSEQNKDSAKVLIIARDCLSSLCLILRLSDTLLHIRKSGQSVCGSTKVSFALNLAPVIFVEYHENQSSLMDE